MLILSQGTHERIAQESLLRQISLFRLLSLSLARSLSFSASLPVTHSLALFNSFYISPTPSFSSFSLSLFLSFTHSLTRSDSSLHLYLLSLSLFLSLSPFLSLSRETPPSLPELRAQHTPYIMHYPHSHSSHHTEQSWRHNCPCRGWGEGAPRSARPPPQPAYIIILRTLR